MDRQTDKTDSHGECNILFYTLQIYRRIVRTLLNQQSDSEDIMLDMFVTFTKCLQHYASD
jgi:hypothetical protein